MSYSSRSRICGTSAAPAVAFQSFGHAKAISSLVPRLLRIKLQGEFVTALLQSISTRTRLAKTCALGQLTFEGGFQRRVPFISDRARVSRTRTIWRASDKEGKEWSLQGKSDNVITMLSLSRFELEARFNRPILFS